MTLIAPPRTGAVMIFNVTASARAGDLIVEEGPFAGTGVTLYRRSVRPAATARARLAIVHGYGDHGGRYAELMHWLAMRGIASEAVDLRGQGAASGRRAYVARWEDYLDDLQSFLGLAPAPGLESLPRFVLGHSHGGLVVAAAGIAGLLGRLHIKGVVLSAPFLRSRLPTRRRHLLLARALDSLLPWLGIPTGLRAEWMSSDARMILDSRKDPLCTHVATARWYLGQLRAQASVMERARDFGLPLLMLIAGADPIADPNGMREFVERSGSVDKSVQIFPDHLHELLRETRREDIFADILAWMRKRW